MLEWLKSILGEQYSPEIDERVAEEIAKGYTPKSDFDGVTRQNAQLQAQKIQMEKEYANSLRQVRLDAAVDKVLASVGAVNPAVVASLLAGFLEKAQVGEDGSVAGLAEEIERLRNGKDTAFLFSQKPESPRLFGATPAGGDGDAPEDPQAARYAARLAKALQNDDTLTAIHLKREAAGQGIFIG